MSNVSNVSNLSKLSVNVSAFDRNDTSEIMPVIPEGEAKSFYHALVQQLRVRRLRVQQVVAQQLPSQQLLAQQKLQRQQQRRLYVEL